MPTQSTGTHFFLEKAQKKRSADCYYDSRERPTIYSTALDLCIHFAQTAYFEVYHYLNCTEVVFIPILL